MMIGINFSIVTKSGKRINSKYLIGYHDAEMTENSYLSKGCYSIGDTSFNLLENRDFSSNKPVPMECFTKRKS